MDKISFQGINNVMISGLNGRSSSGVTNLAAYRVCGTLANDKNGAHFNEFYKALAKSGERNAIRYTPKDYRPEEFIFDISRLEYKGFDIKPQIDFMLNLKDLPLNNDKILPVFSFISKAMSHIEKMAEDSKLKNAAKKINDIIFEAVNDYMRIS